MEETLSSHNPYLLLTSQSPEVSYLSGQQDPEEHLRSSQGGNGSICLDPWCNKAGRDEDSCCTAARVSCSDEESYFPQMNSPLFSEAPRQNKSLRGPGFNPSHSPLDTRGWMDPVSQSDSALWFGLTQPEPITQRLDSFSEAFLSHHRGALSSHPGAHRRVGKAESRSNCVLESSSSPSPTLPSPSAPLMSYVLSPPPTPLTPPSLSPPNMGSPGTVVAPPSQPVDTLWFFPAHRPPLSRPSGRLWKEPIADPGNSSYTTDLHQSENELLVSPSIPPATPLPAPLSDQTGANSGRAVLQWQEAAYGVSGAPFPSILHSGARPSQGHYTPRPLLNPARRGSGLFSSFCPGLGDGDSGEKDGDRALAWVNVGEHFQAQLPLCLKKAAVRSEVKEPPREELLWKPQPDQQRNQDHVEKLLSMCSSSCLPGGGSNTELALHCLHCCDGDVMTTLEMLMFTQPSPMGDYHYSGSDVWTEVEKKCFNSALKVYRKDFSLIQKAVKGKSVSQCVEFYYHSIKPQQMRHKLQKESRRQGDAELMMKNAPPIGQTLNVSLVPEDGAPAPPLASFYPCKLCGKMFYKIKSRNAHMKIHRQPQEDWSDLRPRQLSNRHSGLSGAPMTLLPSGYIPYPSPELSAALMLSSEPGGSSDIPIHSPNFSHTKYRELVLHQAWSSEGLEPMPFYCSSEGRDAQGAGGDEPINWL